MKGRVVQPLGADSCASIWFGTVAAGELDGKQVSINVPQQRSGPEGPGFVVQVRNRVTWLHFRSNCSPRRGYGPVFSGLCEHSALARC
jgi:hypothetical protein